MTSKSTLFTALALILYVVAFGQAPAANFSANTVAGCSPIVVNFQDQSTGNPTTWSWDFGNGSTSSLKNPSTTYFTPGTYTVRLTVTNASGTHTISRDQYIRVYEKPRVNFRVSDSVGCFPLRAQFTDISTAGAGNTNTTWLWDFGNGTQSTEQNPLVTYTSAGNYTVTLKVTNDKGCSGVFVKSAYIRVTGGVTSAFANNVPSDCKLPVTITFANSSSGPGTLSYLWDFGNGITTTEANPTQTFTTAGNYSITLTTTSSDGCSDTLRKTDAIKIEDITTSFTVPDTICVNSPVLFRNTATPQPQSASWSFGDGTTAADINPLKAFAAPGSYTVRLTNTYTYCSEFVERIIQVAPRPQSGFTSANPISCRPPHRVNFTDASVDAVSWQWDFGDSTAISTEQNPVHEYTSYGDFTVRLITTNQFGCTDTLIREQFVRIQRPTGTLFSSPGEGCIPQPVTFSARINSLDAVTSYLWKFGDGTESSSPNPTHVYTVQGTYPVFLIITTSSGCTDTLALSSAVRVGRKPVADLDVTPKEACAFQDMLFTDKTNEADGWLWNFGDGNVSSERNPVYAYSDTGTFTVSLIANNSGCRDTATYLRLVHIKAPIARFGYVPDCDNKLRVAFRDSSIGATTWLWEFGDGTTSTEQHPVHTFPSFKPYSVKLTVTNDTCSHTAEKPVPLVNERPDFSSPNRVACKPSVIYFTAETANAANIVNYTWNFGASGPVESGTASNTYTTYFAAGDYTITLVTTDINGCKDTVQKQRYIRINGPTAGFSIARTTGCTTLQTTFTDTSKNDGVNRIASWTWDFGDGSRLTNTTGGTVQHTYTQTGFYTVKLLIRDTQGCTDSMVVTNGVIVTNPRAGFIADSLSCPGAPVNFVMDSDVSPNFFTRWDFGNGSGSNQVNPFTRYSDTGLYTVKLVITDPYGCTDSISKTVQVGRPVARFTMNDSISSCTPFEVNFTNTSSFYRSSYWDLGVGRTTLTSPTQYYTSPQSYPILLIVTSAGGCTDTARSTVTVFDTVGTKIDYIAATGCKPLPLAISAFSPGPVTYTWDFGDGVLLTSLGPDTTHMYNTFGNFTPKVIMEDPSGCIFAIQGLDTIRVRGANIKFTMDNKLLCDSGAVRFTDSTTFNDPITSFTWNFGDGTTSNDRNPVHYYGQPGRYNVSVEVNTASGCHGVSTDSLVQVVQSPLVRIDGDSVICVHETLTHTGTFLQEDTSLVRWSWQFPNGAGSALQNPVSQRYDRAGDFVVTTSAVNSSGCVTNASQRIRVNPLPNATMPSTLTVQAGFPTLIPATYDSNVVQYTWTPETGLSCTDCPRPEAGPKFDTKYKVTYVNSNGCVNTGEVQVVVICKNANVFVPNTFSPNGDGNNDIFYVRGRGLSRVKSMRVFNRWGEVVFEKREFPVNDAAHGWDGRHMNNKPSADVYIYQVEVYCENGQIIRFEGNIALIQ